MFLELLPLALAAAAYPTLIAMVVVILGRDNPRLLLTAYLAGALFISVAAGCAIVAALTAGHAVGGSNDSVGPGADIVIGLLALVLLWVLLTDRDRGLRATWAFGAIAGGAPPRLPGRRRWLRGGGAEVRAGGMDRLVRAFERDESLTARPRPCPRGRRRGSTTR